MFVPTGEGHGKERRSLCGIFYIQSTMTVISGQEGRDRFERDFVPTSERHYKEGRNFVGGV